MAIIPSIFACRVHPFYGWMVNFSLVLLEKTMNWQASKSKSNADYFAAKCAEEKSPPVWAGG
jgi:hypothetical protein